MARRRTRQTMVDTRDGFYSRALGEAEQLHLREASEVEGVDDEIALLRLRLREMAETSPERIDLQMDLAAAIAQLVKARYQISTAQKQSLKAAVTKVLEEVAVPLGIGIGVGVGGTLRR